MSGRARPLDDAARALFAQAADIRKNAYAPYSGFTVGAALMTKAGRVYLGVNTENAAYPVGCCAERNAIGAAMTAGEREFSAVAICGKDETESCFPCGMCRQMLAELKNPDLQVILSDGVYPLSALLPHTFTL